MARRARGCWKRPGCIAIRRRANAPPRREPGGRAQPRPRRPALSDRGARPHASSPGCGGGRRRRREEPTKLWNRPTTRTLDGSRAWHRRPVRTCRRSRARCATASCAIDARADRGARLTHAHLPRRLFSRLSDLAPPQVDAGRADRRPVERHVVRRRLPPQPHPDAQRAAGGAEEHGLDLRQHQRRRLRQLPAAALRDHATATSRGPSASRKRCRPPRNGACVGRRTWPRDTKAADAIEEVADHPLLDLLRAGQPDHNAFDLWELTTLYQEVHGRAYWLLDPGPLGTPQRDLDSAQPERHAAPRAGLAEPRRLLPVPHRDERAALPARAHHPLPLPRPARPVHRRPDAAAGLLRAGGAHSATTPPSNRRSSRTTPSPTPS